MSRSSDKTARWLALLALLCAASGTSFSQSRHPHHEALTSGYLQPAVGGSQQVNVHRDEPANNEKPFGE